MNEHLTVLYKCNREACVKCNENCTHTDNVKFAEHFKAGDHNPTMFMEVDQFTPDDYQEAALRTASNKNNTYALLTEGVMGLNGEAGECIDIVKKYLYQGHGLDRDHLAEELGDVAWYLAMTASAIGYSLEDILKKNIDKLEARYPDGFDSERSVNR